MQRILNHSLLPAVVLAVGCAELPNSDTADDQIRNSVSDSGNTGIATAWSGADASDLAIPEAGILSFGREYTNISVRYDIERTDASARALVERTASGELVVVHLEGGEVRKGIDSDQASRLVGLDQADSGSWSVDRVSVYQGGSADGGTVIEQVTVSWGDQEVVFDAGDALWDVETLTFLPGEEVTVRVQVNDPAIIGVVHQLNDDVDLVEQKLLESGAVDNEFVNVYSAPSEAGRYFTYVDIFDEAAITEGDAPYSAAAWGMPYFVAE